MRVIGSDEWTSNGRAYKGLIRVAHSVSSGTHSAIDKITITFECEQWQPFIHLEENTCDLMYFTLLHSLLQEQSRGANRAGEWLVCVSKKKERPRLRMNAPSLHFHTLFKSRVSERGGRGAEMRTRKKCRFGCLSSRRECAFESRVERRESGDQTRCAWRLYRSSCRDDGHMSCLPASISLFG